METNKHKISRIVLIGFFVLVLASITVFFYYSYFKKGQSQNNSENNTTTSENSIEDSGEELQQPEETVKPKNADDFYNQSVESANNKNYSQAIIEIDEAIKLNRKNDIYWAKKASYYTLSGDSASAKKTLEEGLVENPNSDLLKTRLDLIDVQIDNTSGDIRN